MSETSRESAQGVACISESFKHPKCVILRLRVNEFELIVTQQNLTVLLWHALLLQTALSIKLDQRIRYSHIEPLQPPELKQKSFHIVLDIDKDMLRDPDFEKVEHEVHHVHRARDGTLYGICT
ncbi:hypothetical protein BDV29DRAFT_168838 [Aspergillus leporis]|uniref:Uncharacterized protein n=1 Tax=Aspergillus leporis TaxID=41062 RepID=A0A5N5X8S6_9EURO|nr:hypothetical protein BDV29DRAFT_168838 [Aspergillus leporis]